MSLTRGWTTQRTAQQYSRADSVVHNGKIEHEQQSFNHSAQSARTMDKHGEARKTSQETFLPDDGYCHTHQQSGSNTNASHYVPAVMTGPNCSAQCTIASPGTTHVHVHATCRRQAYDIHIDCMHVKA
jgi:hypothetical protein